MNKIIQEYQINFTKSVLNLFFTIAVPLPPPPPQNRLPNMSQNPLARLSSLSLLGTIMPANRRQQLGAALHMDSYKQKNWKTILIFLKMFNKTAQRRVPRSCCLILIPPVGKDTPGLRTELWASKWRISETIYFLKLSSHQIFKKELLKDVLFLKICCWKQLWTPQ